MFALGRLFQLAALTLLPIAMFMQLGNQITLWQMLGFSAFGVLLFMLGYALSGYGQASK